MSRGEIGVPTKERALHVAACNLAKHSNLLRRNKRKLCELDFGHWAASSLDIPLILPSSCSMRVLSIINGSSSHSVLSIEYE